MIRKPVPQLLLPALAVLLTIGASWIPCADLQAQDLVPVNSRKTVGWGNSAGELPSPVNPQLDQEDALPETQRGELPQYTGGPTGMPEVITQRYPDGKPQITRRVIQDESGSFLNDGPWKLFNQRGQVLAEGEFRRGLMNGSWQRWHAADSPGLFEEAPFTMFDGPYLSQATFKDGQLDGLWTISDGMRRKIFEMPYIEGERDGRAIWYFPNSMPFREVDFHSGQLHGQLVEYDRENKKARDATYDEGQEIIVRKSFYFKDQQKEEHSFIGPKMEFVTPDDWWNAEPAHYQGTGQELQHGPSREWHANGQLRKAGQYEEGVEVGTFMWWHANGQKQIEGQFDEGMKVGSWTWWHANGQKAIEGSYAYDVEEDLWQWWDENGDLEDERDFSSGPLEIENLENLENLATPEEDDTET